MTQTFNDWEVILIDDGSTDVSSTLCDEYAKSSQNITVIHQKNSGQAASRNSGIEAAKGKYIMFLDSDDYLAGDALQILFDLAEDKKCDITKGKICHFYDNRSITKPLDCTGKVTIYDNEEDSFYSKITHTDEAGSPCAQLYSVEFLNTNGIRFNPKIRFCEDTPFGYSTLLLAKKVASIDLPVYYYRIRQNSTTTSPLTKEQIASTEFIFKDILRLSDKLGDKYRKTVVYWQILNWLVIILNSALDRKSYFELIRPTMTEIFKRAMPSRKYIALYPVRFYLMLADYGVRHDSYISCLAAAGIWRLMRKINNLKKK